MGVGVMDDSTIAGIVERQRAFFNEGRTKDVPFRLRQLKNLRKTILDNEQRIMEALWADMRKPAFEAYSTEVGCALCELNHAIKNVRRWARPQRVPTKLINFPASSYVYPEPLGVVLIVAPWNYPFHLLMLPLVGAIAAGNCAILKPSEIAPHTSAAVADMIGRTFDPSYLTVVEGEAKEAQGLLSQKLDYIFFTGGTAIGRVVMEAAARHLTPVTLELGGKSPCIVDEDIYLDRTARRIVWGKFLNAGQTCVAPDYLLVHTAVRKQLLESMKICIRDFYGEDPSRSPDYARIVSDRHFLRLSQLLKGAEILVGGETNQQDRYIAPTIVDNVSLSDKLMEEEVFGPILPVMDYANLADAISIVNGRPKPLALYFFSRDKRKQQRILRETSSGGVCINDTTTHLVSHYLPFGGVGSSGTGNYHGKSSFDTFSHKKGTLKKSFVLDIPARYPPYGRKLRYLKRFF
jgi:acyl-CoA reductase-like NAD-dependent aldehyde dehydrogenase